MVSVQSVALLVLVSCVLQVQCAQRTKTDQNTVKEKKFKRESDTLKPTKSQPNVWIGEFEFRTEKPLVRQLITSKSSEFSDPCDGKVCDAGTHCVVKPDRSAVCECVTECRPETDERRKVTH